MKNKAKLFMRYTNRVYDISQRLKSVKDGRIGPHIPINSILACILLGFVCRLNTFNQIEAAIRAGEFDKALGERYLKPSGDTLGYSLERVGLEDLVELNGHIIRKARYNKTYARGTIKGLVVVGIDGTELFHSERRRCSCCGVRRYMTEGGEEITQYYERALVTSYVGEGPRLVLDIRRIEKGEVSAAIEAVRELYRRHWRYCHVIAVDALYAQAPFINEVISQRKDVVVKVKQEERHIVKDAEGLFRGKGPDFEGKEIRFGRNVYDVKIWDEEGFTSWENVKAPLRCLKVEEIKKRASDRGIEGQHSYYLVTTLPKSLYKAEVIHEIAHRRWDIENSAIRELKTNWNLDHCCHHEERALVATWYMMIIAFNLFLLFIHRNLRSFNSKRHTMVEVARQILVGLVLLEENIWGKSKAPG